MNQNPIRPQKAPEVDDSGHAGEPRLPLRDWLLLPLIGLLTAGLIFGALKWISARLFYGAGNLQQNCLIKDPATGVHGVPNSVCWAKMAEAPRTEYRYNSCGFRAAENCGPKPPGVYRIVMTGSSFSYGLGTPVDKTFATSLPSQLSQESGRPVEVLNQSEMYKHPHVIAIQFDQILAARPDLILWVLTPFDVKEASLVAPVAPQRPASQSPDAPPANAGLLARTRYNIKVAFAGKPFLEGMRTLLAQQNAQFQGGQVALMLEHYLYESQSQYLKAYLKGGEGDHDTVFLQSHPTAEWEDALQQFDVYAAQIESRAKAAGIPLVAVLIPQRGQTAMISTGGWPAGYDPYKLDNDLRAIVLSHGETYLDILPEFRKIPNPEQDFLPVDGHPNIQGHAVLSRLLTRALTGGAVPALNAIKTTETAQPQGR